jgi:uncharacterized membrane protein
MKVTKARSFVKALSYRIWGTLSSFIVAYVLTGNATLSGAIAFWETVVKVFIYYAHERGWDKISWGRKAVTESAKSSYNDIHTDGEIPKYFKN